MGEGEGGRKRRGSDKPNGILAVTSALLRPSKDADLDLNFAISRSRSDFALALRPIAPVLTTLVTTMHSMLHARD